MHHDIMVRENVSTITIPQMDGRLTGNIISELTHIYIPGDAVQPKSDDPQSSFSSNVAFSSFIQYTTLGDLLPNSTDETVK